MPVAASYPLPASMGRMPTARELIHAMPSLPRDDKPKKALPRGVTVLDEEGLHP